MASYSLRYKPSVEKISSRFLVPSWLVSLRVSRDYRPIHFHLNRLSCRGLSVYTACALVTDGVDINIFKSLKAALDAEDAMLAVVAPRVGGVEASDGSWIEAAQKIGGGPSVLYDVVALLPSEDGVQMLIKEAPARNFVADVLTHMKFIGYVEAASPLFTKAGVNESREDGSIALEGSKGCMAFVRKNHVNEGQVLRCNISKASRGKAEP